MIANGVFLIMGRPAGSSVSCPREIMIRRRKGPSIVRIQISKQRPTPGGVNIEKRISQRHLDTSNFRRQPMAP